MKVFIKLINLLGMTLFWTTKLLIWLTEQMALLTERVTKWLLSLKEKYDVR